MSGGEAQRIKLVSELSKFSVDAEGLLAKKSHETTLFVLDEPTVGLHMADVEKLIDTLTRLADVGGTVVVIEHNIDLISSADWVIDLGPEGGDSGGYLMFEGQAVDLAQKDHSATGLALKKLYKKLKKS